MGIKIKLNDFDDEEELREHCRGIIWDNVDVDSICNVGMAVDLKFNLDGDVVAEEIRIRKKWSDKDMSIRDDVEDYICDHFKTNDIGEIDFSIPQEIGIELDNGCIDGHIDDVIDTIQWHRGFDDSDVDYRLSESLDKLLDKIVECLENKDLEKAERLSQSI